MIDAADFQSVPGLLHLVDVAGEDAGLQAEDAVVHFGERGVEIAERAEDRDRAEGFVRAEGLIFGDVFQQRRLEHGAVALAAAEQFAAGVDGRLDPARRAAWPLSRRSSAR